MMDVRPIRNDDDLAWALAEVAPYFDAPPDFGTPEADRFDVLTDLIEAYEDRHHPIPAASPLDVLRFSMEQNGRSQADLAVVLGSRSRASEVLTGKRGLSLDMIARLQAEWHIPAGALVPALAAVA